jgi:predicted O-methyltransferase YrrM
MVSASDAALTREFAMPGSVNLGAKATRRRRMQRHEFLREIHRRMRPKTYLEIGVSTGASLRLSRSRSIGIDPAFSITHPIRCNLALYKTTSDEYFARDNALDHFRGKSIDLAFIDGMHLAEYALRDFINVERATDWKSVIVFDDMLPRTVDEAARERVGKFWAGDVYKVMLTLREHRPDLVLLPVDTAPTGVLMVLNPDATDTTLSNAYDDLERQYVVPDPQHVPDDVLTRSCAFAPEDVLSAPFWDVLETGRDVAALVKSARSTFG